jgi:hypothetical protein
MWGVRILFTMGEARRMTGKEMPGEENLDNEPTQ